MTLSNNQTRTLPRPEVIVFLALCLLAFGAGVFVSRGAFKNASIIAFAEILFILVYVVMLREPRELLRPLKTNYIVSALILAWFASVTISFFFSPYDLLDKRAAVMRYQQTLLHVILFLVVRDLFSRYQLPKQWVLLAISASGLTIALGMALLWFAVDPAMKEDIGKLWFWKPPFNSHIRHTGYQIAAGVSLLAPFFLLLNRAVVSRATLIVLFVGLCTFLFWMGGRGSVLGVYSAFVLLGIALFMQGIKSRQMWLAIVAVTIAGLILSELLAVFDWNGIIDLIARTASASDIPQITTGRTKLWYSSWVSVQEHPIFGLGPQGYFFMPNRVLPNTIVTVQPHSFLVQFLVEWGVVGSLLFSSLLLYGFYRGFVAHILQANGEVNIAALSAGTLIVALTVNGLFDGTYYHPQPSLYLAIAFAIWTVPRSPAEGERS